MCSVVSFSLASPRLPVSFPPSCSSYPASRRPFCPFHSRAWSVPFSLLPSAMHNQERPLIKHITFTNLTPSMRNPTLLSPLNLATSDESRKASQFASLVPSLLSILHPDYAASCNYFLCLKLSTLTFFFSYDAVVLNTSLYRFRERFQPLFCP